MQREAAKAVQQYGDIIDLPHHVSDHHPPLSDSSRAAQFLPFDALTGYSDAIRRTAQAMESRVNNDVQHEAAEE